jgi:DNA-binding response OmpR family regulator
LLLAEDDEGSRTALARSLERYGYRVLEASDGEAALRLFAAARGEVDLVVLDIGMPRLDGYAVLSRLRQTSDVPVIMLTGRGEEVDRVVGLELGADDYVLKPYSLRELVARIRARLRRQPTRDETPEPTVDETLVFGDLTVDRRAREVHVAGERIDLTAREYELLAFLAVHPRGTARERLGHPLPGPGDGHRARTSGAGEDREPAAGSQAADHPPWDGLPVRPLIGPDHLGASYFGVSCACSYC